MPRRPLLAVLAALVLALLALACSDGGDGDPDPTATQQNVPAATATPVAGGAMSLTSSAFADNEAIPVQYTCDGHNISPPLAIDGGPEDTVSLALTVIDIDGPGGAFVHWTVWNIDPAVNEIPEDTVPGGGIEGVIFQGGDSGAAGYIGPCPPSGTHRYVFTLTALDAPLQLSELASADAIEAAAEGHVLATARLTATYAR